MYFQLVETLTTKCFQPRVNLMCSTCTALPRLLVPHPLLLLLNLPLHIRCARRGYSCRRHFVGFKKMWDWMAWRYWNLAYYHWLMPFPFYLSLSQLCLSVFSFFSDSTHKIALAFSPLVATGNKSIAIYKVELYFVPDKYSSIHNRLLLFFLSSKMYRFGDR